MKAEIIALLHLQKFMKRKDLLHSLIGRGFVVTDRVLRSTVESLIVDDHYCISSGNNGYSLITTEEDLREADRYLDLKASAIARRKNCNRRNFEEQKAKLSAFKSGDQITLFV